MKKVLHLILVVLLPFTMNAQVLKFYQRDTSIKVFAYGQEQTLAWCGGFNTPQFAMADLNHDGLPDLVVFENWNSLRTFLNIGSPGNPHYIYAPEYAYHFPPIYDYCIMADYNRDGIADLFEQGTDGFAVYRGYYNEDNQLCFTFYQNLYYSNDTRTHGYPTNAFDNPGDIPSIVDVDGDGDLDFIAYNIVGGNMNWYRNMQVELGLPPDSIHIELWDNCWGKVYQGFYRTHTLDYWCDNSMLHAMPDSSRKVTHSGNTPCLFDYDMDGDYDYLDGSVSFNQMTFLENGRIPDNPTGADSMVYQDTMWQSTTGGTQINITQFPAAFNVDIDQDGKKDLLIAPNLQNDENYKCIWYYKNLTTPGSPNWQFMSDTFMVDQCIDLGTASYPMLFDYNKDGLPDLFVGSDGYYQPNGTLKAQLSYYQNTGTRGNPVFTLITKDFLGLSAFNFKGIAPAFGDIDNDGKADLLLGHSDGTITYYKNWAMSDTVTPNWQLNMLDLTDMNGDTINVTGHSAPFIYDIDKDGKNDLIIGNVYGTIQYYENVNVTPGTVNLKFINSQLGHIKADPRYNYGIFSTPFIGKIDTTGVDYLMMGGNSGCIYRFTGFQSGDTTATYTMLDSVFSYIDTFDNFYYENGGLNGLYTNYRTSITIGDVGNDGSYELITGNTRGGCELYKWKARSTVGTPVITANEEGAMKVYPNPAGDVLTVTWSGLLNPNAEIHVINMEGQEMYAATVSSSLLHTTVPVNRLPPGSYICELISGVSRYYNRFSVIR